MRFLRQTAAIALGTFVLFGMLATTEASAQTITRQVIGNGATMIYDGTGKLVLGGTVGQPVVGVGGFEPGSIDVYHGFWYFPKPSSSVNSPEGPVAGERSLWNAPNPFTTSTTIHFQIPNRSQVRLRIYDMDGKLVRSLVDASYTAGEHNTAWDARNESGEQVATGYYYYTLDAQPLDQSGQAVSYQQKMLLMK